MIGTDGKVSGLLLEDTVTGERRTLDVTGVFVAIGHEPRTELVKGQVDLDEAGYITVAATRHPDQPARRLRLRRRRRPHLPAGHHRRRHRLRRRPGRRALPRRPPRHRRLRRDLPLTPGTAHRSQRNRTTEPDSSGHPHAGDRGNADR